MKIRFFVATFLLASVIMLALNATNSSAPEPQTTTLENFEKPKQTQKNLTTPKAPEKREFDGFIQYDSLVQINSKVSGEILHTPPVGTQISPGETIFEIDSGTKEKIKNINTKLNSLDFLRPKQPNTGAEQQVSQETIDVFKSKLNNIISVAQEKTIEYKKLNTLVQELHEYSGSNFNQQQLQSVYAALTQPTDITVLSNQQNELDVLQNELEELTAAANAQQEKSTISGEVIFSVPAGTDVEKNERIVSIGEGKKRIYVKVDSKTDIVPGMKATLVIGDIKIPATVGFVDSTAEIIPEKEFNLAANQKIKVIFEQPN